MRFCEEYSEELFDRIVSLSKILDRHDTIMIMDNPHLLDDFAKETIERYNDDDIEIRYDRFGSECDMFFYNTQSRIKIILAPTIHRICGMRCHQALICLQRRSEKLLNYIGTMQISYETGAKDEQEYKLPTDSEFEALFCS